MISSSRTPFLDLDGMASVRVLLRAADDLGAAIADVLACFGALEGVLRGHAPGATLDALVPVCSREQMAMLLRLRDEVAAIEREVRAVTAGVDALRGRLARVGGRLRGLRGAAAVMFPARRE